MRSSFSAKLQHFVLALGVAAGALSVSSGARADAVSCAATAENAQSLRQRKKLVEAQKQLVACASADCPKFVRADCLRWLDEVQSTLPTLVVRASDPTGNDVLEGNVVVDGAPGAALGSAMPLDPGPHVLLVKRGADAGELRVLVAEGEKNRIVVVKLEKAGATPSASPPPVSPASSSVASPAAAGSPGSPDATSSRGRGPAPWIAGGIGVVGLITFGVLQIAAQDQYDKLRQTCAPQCDGSEVDSVRSKVTLSAVALGVGVVGIGAGVALWFALDPGESSTARSAPNDRRGVSLGATPTPGGAEGSLRLRF